MSSQLINPLNTLRATLRRLAVLRGVALVVTVLLALVMLVGTADWMFHFDDNIARLVLGLAICAAVLFVLLRWVIQPAFAKLTDLHLAKRIENAYPEFTERLSSSVEFIREPPPGSEELRDQTITRATDDVQNLELESLPDRQPLRQASVIAISLTVLALAFFVVRPVEAKIAVRRLMFPFSNQPWPRTTDYRVINEAALSLPDNIAQQVVRGEYREVLVENTRGDLPEDSAIEYRLGKDGAARFETLQPIKLETETTGEVGRALLAPTKSPIYYRAVGGDHQTAWFRLDVVQPPTIKSVAIELTYPGYTNKATELLPGGTTTIQGLVGSAVRVTAIASKPLKSAQLIVLGDEIDAELTDPISMMATFDLDREGLFQWWFELEDQTGVTNPRPVRYDLRITRDEPPSVYFDLPNEDIQVTANAAISVHVTASDDERVRELTVEGSTNGSSFPISLDPDPAEDDKTVGGGFDLLIEDYGLQPGETIVLQATATDDMIDVPTHTTRSGPLTLTIVAPDVKAAELAGRQTDLLDELSRVLTAQRKARDSVAELQIQQEQTGQFRRSDFDLLRRSEIDQHRIASTLFDESDGILQRAQQLAADFDANRVDGQQVRSQLDKLTGELGHIRDQLIGPLEQTMTAARKQAELAMNESETENVADVANRPLPLSDVETQQTEIVETIAALLADTDGWRQQIDLRSSLARVGKSQDELNRDVAQLAERSLQAQSDADRNQIAADANRLARRQDRVAEEFDQLANQVQQSFESLNQDDVPATTSLSDFARAIRESGISNQMKDAAAELLDGRASAAGDLQASVTDELQRLQSLLEAPPTSSAQDQLNDLNAISESVRDLLERQNSITKELETNGASPELGRRQSEVRSETERQQRQLDRVNAPASGQALANAAETMQAAEHAIRDQEKRKAADSAALAAKRLRDALNSIKQQQQRAQQQVADQEFRQAVLQIRNLVQSQTKLRQQTEALEQQRLERGGRRTRKQSREVLGLAGEQSLFSDRLGEVSDSFSETPVIALILESATTASREAANQLGQRVTNASATQPQQRVLDSLNEILQALQPKAPDDSGTQPTTDANTANQSEQQSSELLPILTRLKLLRSLQQRAMDETRQLTDQESDDSEERRLQIARQQKKIAEITQQLIQELKSGAER